MLPILSNCSWNVKRGVVRLDVLVYAFRTLLLSSLATRDRYIKIKLFRHFSFGDRETHARHLSQSLTVLIRD